MSGHRVTVSLDGVATDSASVELDDAAAFLLFVNMKTALLQGAPAKRRTRRGSASATDDAVDPAAAGENDEG
jgi:hypothetical protein